MECLETIETAAAWAKGRNEHFSRIASVRGVARTSVGALAVLLVALGLAACGGGSDSSSSSAAESTASTRAESGADGGAARKESAGGKSPPAESKNQSGGGATNFVPKPHHDSGGGSTEFRTKGGDNSVQEFGSEVEGSEFEAAAAALHDFLDARGEGDWPAACDYISRTVVESLEKLAAKAGVESGDCGASLEKLTNPAARPELEAEAEKANVRSLRSEGEQGYLIYTAGGTVYSMSVVNEDGSWKVSSLIGYQLSG